jgi:plastocyanin
MRLVNTALAPLLVGALACGDGPTDAPGNAGDLTRVPATIADLSFTPATLNVRAGTQVTWKNNGPSIHTVTSDAGLWHSDRISGGGVNSYGSPVSGGSYSRIFDQVGEFPYHCAIHPTMTGKVVVSE